MDAFLPHLTLFSTVGRPLLAAILAIGFASGLLGLANLFSPSPLAQKTGGRLLWIATSLFALGFAWIAWFHFRIHQDLPLLLPGELASWLNRQLAAMNQGAAYGLPLYDPAHPPRYIIPLWIENEKYFFWFFCYAGMALVAHHRLAQHRFRGVLGIFLAIQCAILFFVTDPFTAPLPRFFAEITPWFTEPVSAMQRFGMFMKLYPRMIFYYNAEYMWMHPPLLFLSYACITLTFITSVFMLARRELAIEILGYAYAKTGYFMLTLGMLLGYPWALQAWGPNWWWDPKICSSIMMWAVFSTYLHTRLYANKKGMWYFSALLGILCFLAMLFTFLASFYFPGEHTFQ